MIVEAEQISRFKQPVMEELQAQQVYVTLASESRKEEAHRIFPPMISFDSPPPEVASSSHIGGDKKCHIVLLTLRFGAWLMPLL